MPQIVIGLCVNTDRFLRYLEYLAEGINAPLGMKSLRGNMNFSAVWFTSILV